MKLAIKTTTVVTLLLASLVAATQGEHFSFYHKQVIVSTPEEAPLKPKTVAHQPKKIREKFLELQQKKPALTLEEHAEQTGSPGKIERSPTLVIGEGHPEPPLEPKPAQGAGPPGIERQKTVYQEPPSIKPPLLQAGGRVPGKEHRKAPTRTTSVPTLGTGKEEHVQRTASAMAPTKKEAEQHQKIRDRFIAEQGKSKEKLTLPPISPKIAAFEEAVRQKKNARAMKRYRAAST